MKKIFVKPKKGLKVRHPDKPGWPHIPADGQAVKQTVNITRLLQSKDLQQVATAKVARPQVADTKPAQSQSATPPTDTQPAKSQDTKPQAATTASEAKKGK